mmetsp:Transcript_111296/g.202423  ORF Transcript_111296/g.202423 Transcript_111296/m.202423 type:complete len:263 (+) Transcript_111296:123-911(+)
MFVDAQQSLLVWLLHVSVASSVYLEHQGCAIGQVQKEVCDSEAGSLSTQGHSLLQAVSIVKGGRSALQSVNLSQHPASEPPSRNVSLLHLHQWPGLFHGLKYKYEGVKLKLADMFGDIGQLDSLQLTIFLICLGVFLFCLCCFFISVLCPEPEPELEYREYQYEYDSMQQVPAYQNEPPEFQYNSVQQVPAFQNEPPFQNELPVKTIQCSNCGHIFGMPPGYANFNCPNCGMLHRLYTSAVHRTHIRDPPGVHRAHIRGVNY